MSPARKKKISNQLIATATTHNTSTHTDNTSSTSSSVKNSDNNNANKSANTPVRLPSHFVQYLTGMGQAPNKEGGINPKFKGNRDKYQIFELKLRNLIALHDLEDFLDSDDCDDVKNLCLYHLISQCLDDGPLMLIMT